MKFIALLSLFLSANIYAEIKTAEPVFTGKWTLQGSTVTYTVTHIKTAVNGTSHMGRGQGQCDTSGDCQFMVSIPVKSFDSGNTKRDQRMLDIVRSSKFPNVVVNFHFHPGGDLSLPLFTNALVIFAGREKKMNVDGVKLVRKSEKEIEADLTLPLVLTDFDVERPTLLSVPIDDNVPVHIHGNWVHD
jgi:hypothetical protein